MRLFATCARGLEPVLARELAGIRATEIEPGRGGVGFTGTMLTVYRANLELRSAVRVLRPLLTETVRDPDQLYDAVRTIDWSRYLTYMHTLAVDCNVKNSNLTHSQYAARRVKDAICDQFRDKTGKRPSVDAEHPAVGLNLHVSHDEAILSLDSSWVSLHKRGYRPIQPRAPINEALAAGMLLHLGYDGTRPLIDPLCGSGTFAIEAAWIALRRPPGLTRKYHAFIGWPEFDRGEFANLRDELRRNVLPELPAPIFGSELRPDVVRLAKENANAAGVGHAVQFDCKPVSQARPPCPLPDGVRGLIVTNPPYGERLGEDGEELESLYQDIGQTVRDHWQGWELALFTANGPMARRIRLAGRTSTPFYNGSLACRLWQFPAWHDGMRRERGTRSVELGAEEAGAEEGD